MKDATVLIVGGAGFVGSALVRALLPLEPKRIVVVDNFLSSERALFNAWRTGPRPSSTGVDLGDGSIASDGILRWLGETHDPAYIFHLATYHGNRNSMANPLADHEHNCTATLKLYEALRAFKGLKKVVYAGAGCAFAEKSPGAPLATREDAPLSMWPDTPYQASKIVGELYSNLYAGRYGLPIVRARFQNVYGPGEILGAGEWRGTDETVWRNVVPTFIWKALHDQPLVVYGDGSRDFIYVDDIARGLIACAMRGAPGEAYNLASGREESIHDLARLVVELAGSHSTTEMVDHRDWDRSGRRYGSPAKAKERLGFASEVELRDGLRRTIAWTRANTHVIEAAIAKHAEHMERYAHGRTAPTG